MRVTTVTYVTSVQKAQTRKKLLTDRSKFLYFYFVSTFSVFDRGDGRYVQS